MSLMEMYYTLKALSMDKIAVVRTITTVGAMVLSCVWGAVILREQIHWNGIAALVLILGGILYQSAEKKK